MVKEAFWKFIWVVSCILFFGCVFFCIVNLVSGMYFQAIAPGLIAGLMFWGWKIGKRERVRNELEETS